MTKSETSVEIDKDALKKEIIELVSPYASIDTCYVDSKEYFDINTFEPITYKLLDKLSKIFNTEDINISNICSSSDEHYSEYNCITIMNAKF